MRLQKTGKAAVITHAVDLKQTEVKLQVLQFICIIECCCCDVIGVVVAENSVSMWSKSPGNDDMCLLTVSLMSAWKSIKIFYQP